MQKMMKKILLLLHDANMGFNKALFKGYSIKYEIIHSINSILFDTCH